MTIKNNFRRFIMKKRNFFRAIVLMILTLSLAASSFVLVSAKAPADGTVLFNEDMLAGKDLSKMFTIATNSGTAGTVAYEKGALKFTGTGGLDRFDLTGASLGLSTDITDYTVMADVSYDVLGPGTDSRFQVAVRPSTYTTKNHDWFSGILLRGSKGIVSAQICNTIVSTSKTLFPNTNIGVNAFNDEGNANVISLKIVVKDNSPTYYIKINDGEWVKKAETTDVCNVENVENILAFVVRVGTTVTVDNLTVYAGTGEAPDASPAEVAPWGLGYQLSDVYQGANGKVANIRFIALGTDMNVENVGFKVTANVDGKAWDKNTTTVYSELWGKDAAGVNGAVAKAEDYGADFIYGLAITGIPTDTDIVFTVTPYATKGGETVNGATFQVTVNVPSN